ncbi:MAG: tRNA methyl transferase PRC-barrel domain-containing protein, partial [Lentilitoribacter sp.]
RFPLGGMPKSRVRELAHEFGLSIADKPDSQDICFVPNGDYAEVIRKLRPNAVEPGDIVHIDGRILGQHEGIIHFTIGQRRGIGVAASDPLYVVRLDADAKRVIVGPREALATRKVFLREVNWIGDTLLDDGAEIEIFAKVRSTRPPAPAIVRVENGTTSVELTSGEAGVAPGQACVFFDSDTEEARVLGGGWIARTERAGHWQVDSPQPEPQVSAV